MRVCLGREVAGRLPFSQKAEAVQNALLADICGELGDSFDQERFIPSVMMHEFEGLLFSDCTRFGQGIGRPELIPQFQTIRSAFTTPEEINDSPLTAASKRVEALVPGYQKPSLGTRAAQKIGIGTIRAECPHFRNWLERLESWP